MSPEEYRSLIERHATAVLERIREDDKLNGLVFEGDVDDDPDMYVNVFHDTGFYSSHEMTDLPVDVEVTFTIHSVGKDRWQAVWASGRVTAQLLRFVPTIDRRRCWRVRHEPGPPVAKDIDASPIRFLAIDRFILRSTPK